MNARFHNMRGLRTRSFDGRHFIVDDHLEFTDSLGNLYCTELYMRTDGGSIPPLSFIGALMVFIGAFLTSVLGIWYFILCFLGILVSAAGLYLTPYARWWWAYILHDSCYQNRLYRFYNGSWKKCTLTEWESNWLLYDAMKCQHARWWEYTIVWLMLNWFGWRAFDEDRKAASGESFWKK